MAGCACPEVRTRERRMLIVAEVLRWVVIVIPVYLGVWRYSEIRGYTVFVKNVSLKLQFWGIISAIIVGISLLFYLPLKLAGVKYRVKKNTLSGLLWRPSIVTYIILSAVPVLLMIVIAAKREGQDDSYMDPITVVVLQVMVIGLTLTEWISKLREEHLTFDLVSAMADDFFFAYDVIDFIMMATHEEEIYRSVWVYVCFAFAFVAMFKYVPAQPINITGESGPRSKVVILVSMFCCDVPFVIIRLWTMIVFSFRVSDLLHPVKNIALIVFDIMQLVIIHRHKDHPEAPDDITDGIIPHVAPQTRRARKDDGADDVDIHSAFPRTQSGWDLLRRRVLEHEAANRHSGPGTVNNQAFQMDNDDRGKRGAFEMPGEVNGERPSFT